ncbi:MAG: hypothetical protein ACYC1Q_11950 [Bacteroidia bacterium]
MKKALVLVLVIVVAACTKEKTVEIIKEVPEPAAATITYVSPAEADTVSNSQSVHLKATINGKNLLHGYSFGLIRNDSEVVFYKHVHQHASTFDIDTTWTSSVSDTSEMMIIIEAITTHDGNSVGKSLEYLAIP